ncbi:MAG: kelch repeat-containing protein [Bacteroidota bacterium]
MKVIVPYLLIFALSFGQYSLAQTVQTTGPLNKLRTWHQSQMLQNGHVLAFGGQNNGVLGSAELYDPATEMWTQATEMLQPRTQFTSVVLDDGRVMAIGGSNGTAETNTCEIYDPSTNSWSFTDTLAVNTSFASSVKLPDGRVMMTYQTTCQIYNPDSAKWFSAPSPSANRKRLFLLSNGKVLHLGISTNAEVYDPASNTWAAVSNDLSGSTTGADGVSTMGDGRVLINGGFKAADIYDPASNSFSSATDMLIGIPLGSSIGMTNGNVLVFGPSSATNGSDTKSIQVYNPIDNQWFSDVYGFYGPARSNLHILQNGKVLSVGGSARLGGLADDCYLIDPSVAAVSVDDLLESISLKMYPNPAREQLHIELGEWVAGDILLRDLRGRTVLTQKLGALQTQMTVSHLPKGVYMLSLRTEAGLSHSQKLVIE